MDQPQLQPQSPVPDAAPQIDQWLVRTADNQIQGPYSKEQVILLIREGTIGAEDEVCRANHYWITLSETDEVMSQLGIQAPTLRRDPDEEVTETQTEMDLEERTDPDLASEDDGSQAENDFAGDEPQTRVLRPKASSAPRTSGAPASVSTGDASLGSRSAPFGARESDQPFPEAENGDESASFLRKFGGLLLAAALLLAAFAYRFYRQKP